MVAWQMNNAETQRVRKGAETILDNNLIENKITDKIIAAAIEVQRKKYLKCILLKY